MGEWRVRVRKVFRTWLKDAFSREVGGEGREWRGGTEGNFDQEDVKA